VSVDLGALVVVLGIAGIVGLFGVLVGIFFLAPRLARLADRMDEDPRDRDD
jgi:hypothetical protein